MGPVRERHSRQSPKSSPGQSPRRCSSLGGPQPLGHWKAQSRCLHLPTARHLVLILCVFSQLRSCVSLGQVLH